MSWQRILFIAIVAAGLAWVFLAGPAVRTELDGGMNGGQQVAPTGE